MKVATKVHEYRGFYIGEGPLPTPGQVCVFIKGTYNNTRLPERTYHTSVYDCKCYIDDYLETLTQ